MLRLWNAMPETVKEIYTAQYFDGNQDKALSMFGDSMINKASLAALFPAMQDGIVKLSDGKAPVPSTNLLELIGNTIDSTVRNTLGMIDSHLPTVSINANHIHRSDWENAFDNRVGWKWPDSIKADTATLTKIVEALHGSTVSQVLSKIYSGKRVPLYLSVRPSDYLQISDSSLYASCHATMGGGYASGNLDYMLDGVTAVVFASKTVDGAAYESESYMDSKWDSFGPNMLSRVLVHVTKDAILVGKSYGNPLAQHDVCALVRQAIGTDGWEYSRPSPTWAHGYKGYQDDYWYGVSRRAGCRIMIAKRGCPTNDLPVGFTTWGEVTATYPDCTVENAIGRASMCAIRRPFVYETDDGQTRIAVGFDSDTDIVAWVPEHKCFTYQNYRSYELCVLYTGVKQNDYESFRRHAHVLSIPRIDERLEEAERN